MESLRFQLDGEILTLTRQEVIDSVRHQIPEPVQTWAVEIEGRRFPVKQALSAATKVDRSRFISTQARSILGKLGFRVTAGRGAGEPPTPMDTLALADWEGAKDYHLRIRLAALQFAVELATHRTEATAEEVLSIAESCEAWLAR